MERLGTSSSAKRGRRIAEGGGGGGRSPASGIIVATAAPSTMLRMVPLPRFAEEDLARPLLGLLALLATLLSTPALADPQPSGPAVDPSIGTVEVTLEVPKDGDKPYVGEMILLRMRSFVRADIVLDEIQQPPLLNFSWQQLGRDKPISAMVDGFQVSGLERDLAIFPGTSGRLIIEPFVRHVTIVTNDNERVGADFSSKPVYVDVQNYTAINPADAWWLPAKSLTLAESWSQVPDEIKPGTLTRRTIVVEAAGLTADRLPPPPEMQAPGTIVFRGPVDRITTLTEDGPVARGTYVWDLRPTTSAPAKLPPVAVAWFDTEQRRMRSSAIPETWIADIGTLVHPSHEKPKTLSPLSPGPLAAGLAGLAWAATLAGFLATSRRKPGRRALRRARALAALRRAGRSDDAPGFTRALVDLGRADAPRWRQVAAAPAVAPRLVALDAARFGRGGAAAPALKPLAADIRRLWLDAEPAPHAPDDELPPLDAPI